ncbi:hypothetical protein ABDI30_06975 [Paenibacillus cisolokensis]|uniref:hypothetical protein n=1 Tax=Paenibacillus cisolokensis TaxID=1658519 RepID=UPI003D2A8795
MFKSIGSLEDRLIELFQEILKDNTFESYESCAGEIDALFLQLQQRENKEYDLGKLAEIKKLHDQVVSMIQHEKEGLGKEINEFSKKKKVSSQYGKVSYYEGMDAFFVDYKSK